MAITPGVGTVDEANNLMIAAGRCEELLYGSLMRSCYFVYQTDTLRFINPYIFAASQTGRYDAATMVRRNESVVTETVDGVPYVVGARFRRVTDAARKFASDGTKLDASAMRDDLGWVVLFTRTEGTSGPTTCVGNMQEKDMPLRPYVVDGVICVDGCEQYDVYSMQGVKMDSRKALSPGIYVVKVAHATAMVLVK